MYVLNSFFDVGKSRGFAAVLFFVLPRIFRLLFYKKRGVTEITKNIKKMSPKA